MASRFVPLIATLLVGCVANAASAQVVGEFRWQTQPFCNVLTLTVVQQGARFHVSGADDLCGAGTAPVTGTAVANGGSATIGVTIALPSGASAHVTATISLVSVSGTWNDADGRSGPFVFNAATGGAPRPAPATAAVITPAQLSPTIFAGSGAGPTIARSDHDHDERYAGRAVRLQVSPWGLRFQYSGNPLALSALNGCPTAAGPVPVTAILPLSVPSGAVLHAVETRAYALSNAIHAVSLIAEAPSVNGAGAPTTLATSSHGAGQPAGTVTHTLTPPSPFVVQPGTVLRLTFDLSTGDSHGVCAAEVRYTLPGAP